jgi:hypothetical protein
MELSDIGPSKVRLGGDIRPDILTYASGRIRPMGGNTYFFADLRLDVPDSWWKLEDIFRSVSYSISVEVGVKW